MAKKTKTTKKPATKKTAKKTAAPSKKKAAKAAPKPRPAKKSPSRAAKAGSAPRAKSAGGAAAGGPNPAPVSTGPGLSPLEIGRDLVAMFNAGQLHEIEAKHWSPEIVSVEGHGVAMAWSGRAAVEEKNRGWSETHTVHGASAEGPYVGAAGFAVKFRMDVEDKTTGQRELAEEIGVYTVHNGKIVREEFMYQMA